jgi:hypothetical protein
MAAQLLVLVFCSFTSPDSIQPIKLPPTINTLEGEEYGPTLTIDDNTIYFVRLNPESGSASEDIYMSRRNPQTGEWGSSRRVEGLSHQYRNEAPTSVSADGSMMLLFVEGHMCFSQHIPYRGWTEPQALPPIFRLGNWQADAMISADGSAILFAANYPVEGEEQPSLNIFVSIRDEQGRWSKPFSIGSAINTSGMERSPFLHPDMKTLYFSSDRPGTVGELDVWVSRKQDKNCWDCWSEPENLGPQINTPGRDCWYKITTDGKMAYFARKSGRNQDIYCIPLPEDKRPESISLFDP